MIAIALSLAAFCQTTFHLVKTVNYSQYINEEWVDQDTNSTEGKDIYMIFDGDKIKITNKNESSYLIYGDVTDRDFTKYTAKTWSAYDKNGESCYVMIKRPKVSTGLISVSVINMNKNECFEFIVESK